jgi:hypothetical protein
MLLVAASLGLLLGGSVSAQELIWQGTVDVDAVRVTANELRNGDALAAPLPITIATWEMGYRLRFYAVDEEGTPIPCDIPEGHYAASIPDLPNGRWYLAPVDSLPAPADERAIWLPTEPHLSGTWQLSLDRYVLNAWPSSAHLFTVTAGARTTLLPDATLNWPVIAATGTIAGIGTDTTGLAVVRVLAPDGSLIYAATEASINDQIRDLTLARDGAFVEYTVETRAPDHRDRTARRVRVDLASGRITDVGEVFSGARLRSGRRNLAIWSDGARTLIQRLDDVGNWWTVADVAHRLYLGYVLDAGGLMLAYVDDDAEAGTVRLNFHDDLGRAVAGPFQVKFPYEILECGGGIIIVHSLGQTSVFRVGS